MASRKPTPPPSPPPPSARSELSAEVITMLGDSRRFWEAMVQAVSEDVPGAALVWKRYAGKSGLQCVIRRKDRNLAYLKPGEGRLLFSTALSDLAVRELAKTDVPPALIREVEASAVYPEGRPARVLIDSPSALAVARTLLRLKIADVGRRKP